MPVRGVRTGVHRPGLVGVLGLAVAGLLAGCGGTSAPSSTTAAVGPKLDGVGATTAQWNARHASGGGSAAHGPSYGPAVPMKGGAIDTYTDVTTTDGRVVGWTMAFADGTTIGAAEADVRAQLPDDTRQTASRRARFGSSSDTCEIVSYESQKLKKALGAGRSTVGVTLYQIGVNGKRSPSIEVVDRAIVQVPARGTTTGC
jgi:hypothetical protein